MENHGQRFFDIRRSFDKRVLISQFTGCMVTHPKIYLDVESDDSNHSPVNINKVHLVLTSS